MFNSLPVPQQQHQLSGPSGAKLHAAVQSLKVAFADILDQNNYTSADINDPYVSFALSLYSRYNNDPDFHNMMTILMQLPPQLDIRSNINPAGAATAAEPGTLNLLSPAIPYLYHSDIPFVFSLFPSFPYLPLGELTPTLLNDDLEFERFCLVGTSILEYLIKITLYKKEKNLPAFEIMKTVRSIINTRSLTILCQAYNVEFNYKFMGYQAAPSKIFLSYFGKYYEHYLKEGDAKVEWEKLFKWMEQLLGYVDEENVKGEDESRQRKVDSQGIAKGIDMGVSHPEASNMSEPNYLEDKPSVSASLDNEKSQNEQFNLQELIQSVQQDLNQSICSSVEISYSLGEHPDLKTGMFSCKFFLDKVEFSSASAVNKKLAKSGAALFAAIDNKLIKFLKRSYHDYWTKKYIQREALIRRAFSLDSRFEYKDAGSLPPNVSVSNEMGISEDHSKASNLTDPAIEKEKTLLSTAKEKVYAYYNSKFNIVPKYEFSQLGNARFEARLFLGDKMVSSAEAPNKKDAGAKAALQVIEQNLDVF